MSVFHSTQHCFPNSQFYQEAAKRLSILDDLRYERIVAKYLLIAKQKNQEISLSIDTSDKKITLKQKVNGKLFPNIDEITASATGQLHTATLIINAEKIVQIASISINRFFKEVENRTLTVIQDLLDELKSEVKEEMKQNLSSLEFWEEEEKNYSLPGQGGLVEIQEWIDTIKLKMTELEEKLKLLNEYIKNPTSTLD
jgi:hypothetical protein